MLVEEAQRGQDVPDCDKHKISIFSQGQPLLETAHTPVDHPHLEEWL